MKRHLIRLFLLATLLCWFPGSRTEVMAQAFTAKDDQKDEEQIKQNDGYQKPVAEEPQSPVEVVFRSAPSTHRIVSNRPTRLLPTHGGKPSKHHGRWSAGEVYKPFKIATQQLCRDLCRRHTVATSPRLRYVIALRRLLC